jgi:hypothetical protein
VKNPDLRWLTPKKANKRRVLVQTPCLRQLELNCRDYSLFGYSGWLENLIDRGKLSPTFARGNVWQEPGLPVHPPIGSRSNPV